MLGDIKITVNYAPFSANVTVDSSASSISVLISNPLSDIIVTVGNYPLSGLPPGGTDGQVLKKIGSLDYESAWEDMGNTGGVWGTITGTLSDQTDLWNYLHSSIEWSAIINTPTSLSGYGIADPVVLQNGTYSDPAFITSLSWSKIISYPPFVLQSRNINTTSPLAGGGDLSVDRTLSIANAAADGVTKGAAAFTAADFNSAAGVISIDYTNGQAASASLKGFLTSADWTTFNNKVATTRAINTSSPLSGGGDLSADRTLSIANAAADGVTKGAAAFAAADFNSASGVISIDYTNGQAASGSQNGFLTSADWTTFNNKQSALTFSTGLTNTSGTITDDLATGKAGGLTAKGGTGSGENLTLQSTTHATRGKIYFGTAQLSFYDEANTFLRIVNPTQGTTGIHLQNTTPATAVGNQTSPIFQIETQGWNAASLASNSVQLNQFVSPYTLGGASPEFNWTVMQSINGGTAKTMFQVSSVGTVATLDNGTHHAFQGFYLGRTDYSSTNAGSTSYGWLRSSSAGSTVELGVISGAQLTFFIQNTEQMRMISGSFLVGTSSVLGSSAARLQVNGQGLFETAALGATTPFTAGTYLRNRTAAAAGAQQYSPPLILEGQGWATTPANSQAVAYAQYIIPVQAATNPNQAWTLAYSTAGGAFTLAAQHLKNNNANLSYWLFNAGDTANTAGMSFDNSNGGCFFRLGAASVGLAGGTSYFEVQCNAGKDIIQHFARDLQISNNATTTSMYISASTGKTGFAVAPTGNGYLQVYAGTSQNAKVGGSIFDHFADAGNTTTGETDLYSDTLAASTFTVNGDAVRAQYGGITVAHATNTRRIRVYFGGTVILDTTAVATTTAANWFIDVTVIRDSTTSVRCMATLSDNNTSLMRTSAYTTVTALTLTNTQIIKVTGQSSSSTNDIVAKLSKIEYLSAA